MLKRQCKRRRGIIMLELAISLFVVLLMVMLTAQTIMQFSKTRAHYAARETAAWAAEAQLARIQAGAPADSAPPNGLIPEGVALETLIEPGTGIWSHMRLVRVRATITPKHGKTVVEEVRGYVAVEKPQ